MDKEEVIKILQKAVNEIKEHEDECYREMAYLNEHKFEMEREAVRYKQEAFSKSWVIVSVALDSIKEWC